MNEIELPIANCEPGLDGPCRAARVFYSGQIKKKEQLNEGREQCDINILPNTGSARLI